MSKFRNKPVVIEAIQFTGKNSRELHEFAGGAIQEPVDKNYMEVETLEGIMMVSKNDYVIKGVSGEFYPCKPDIFDKTYEKADIEETFMDRLQKEKLDLSEKVDKLSSFINNEAFEDIVKSKKQRYLLMIQFMHMNGYLEALNSRIDNLAIGDK